jgi:hypothetical protein
MQKQGGLLQPNLLSDSLDNYVDTAERDDDFEIIMNDELNGSENIERSDFEIIDDNQEHTQEGKKKEKNRDKESGKRKNSSEK